MNNESYRCSEAPIIIHCGLAATPPEHPIDTTGPEAAVGLAVHDSLEAWIKSGCIGEPEAQPHADSHGVDPETVETLIHAAPDLLAKIPENLAGIVAEVTIYGGLERGRIDVLAVQLGDTDQPLSVAILDWKTGRDPIAGSRLEQRLAYASAVEDNYGMPASGYIYTAEIWLATHQIVEARHTLADIETYRARIRGRLAHPAANPGAHCRYCRRVHECEARNVYIRSAVSALTETPPEALTPDKVGALWDQSRALKQALDFYEKIVDSLVDLTGELPLPDGRKIVHVQVPRDVIDARKAWPSLEAHGLTLDEINGAISVSKTKLLAAVAKRAPRGHKATAKAGMITDLDLAGAIRRTVTRRKKVVGPGKGE